MLFEYLCVPLLYRCIFWLKYFACQGHVRLLLPLTSVYDARGRPCSVRYSWMNVQVLLIGYNASPDLGSLPNGKLGNNEMVSMTSKTYFHETRPGL